MRFSELTEYERELIKESLLRNSVSHIDSSSKKKNEMGNEWSRKMLKKSSDMLVLLKKFK